MKIKIQTYVLQLGWCCEKWYLNSKGKVAVETKHIESVSIYKELPLYKKVKQTKIIKHFFGKDTEEEVYVGECIGSHKVYKVTMVSGNTFETLVSPFDIGGSYEKDRGNVTG